MGTIVECAVRDRPVRCVGRLGGLPGRLTELGYEVVAEGSAPMVVAVVSDERQSAEAYDALVPGGTLIALRCGALAAACRARLDHSTALSLGGASPEELKSELAGAGFVQIEVRGADGYFGLIDAVEDRMGDLRSRAALLAVLRRIGKTPAIAGTSSWMIGTARRPGDGGVQTNESDGATRAISIGPASEQDESIMAGYYSAGSEQGRLESRNRLEFERTKAILTQCLPPGGRVLDVGGGPGVYSSWLAGLGYDVNLVDPIPLHVQQAQQASSAGARFEAAEGDARHLSVPDAVTDAVIMLGPLFHLVDRSDRLAALREAHRVLRPGGVLAASAMGRTFLLGHAVAADTISSRSERERVLAVAESGFRTNPPVPFPAFAHQPDQLDAELREAGFQNVQVCAIEGFLHLVGREDQPSMFVRLELLDQFAADPGMIAASGHIMAVGVR